jgi:hypothetical protein
MAYPRAPCGACGAGSDLLQADRAWHRRPSLRSAGLIGMLGIAVLGAVMSLSLASHRRDVLLPVPSAAQGTGVDEQASMSLRSDEQRQVDALLGALKQQQAVSESNPWHTEENTARALQVGQRLFSHELGASQQDLDGGQRALASEEKGPVGALQTQAIAAARVATQKHDVRRAKARPKDQAVREMKAMASSISNSIYSLSETMKQLVARVAPPGDSDAMSASPRGSGVPQWARHEPDRQREHDDFQRGALATAIDSAASGMRTTNIALPSTQRIDVRRQTTSAALVQNPKLTQSLLIQVFPSLLELWLSCPR